MNNDAAALLHAMVGGATRKETPQQRKSRRKYEAALRRHEADIAKAAQAFDRELRDPDANEALGLPRELPESAIDILKQTRALDAKGDKRPTRSAFTR